MQILMPNTPYIKTIEQARDFVKEVKVCTIFQSEKTEHVSLYEMVDYPKKQPGEGGWGERIGVVWAWKNQLPAEYPTEIFYGKLKNGLAALMDLEYVRNVHFPNAYVDIKKQDALTQFVFERILEEPWDTTSLRKVIIQETGCSKGQFDKALKNLQITMNIVRLNDAQIERDTWVPFKEVYLDIWQNHVKD
jgi:hypothetical protein